jgi:DNA-binding NarL/FixJ family response regulator
MIKTLVTPCKFVDQTSIISTLEKAENVILKAPRDIEHLTLLKDHTYDIGVLCPDTSKEFGLDMVEYITKNWIGIRLIIITDIEDREYLEHLSTKGAYAYLAYSSVSEKLEDVVNQVFKNEKYMDEALVEDFEFIYNEASFDISKREKEIIWHIANGYTTNQIADKLFISPHTVKTHRKNINSKLDIHSPAQLVEFARKNNI